MKDIYASVLLATAPWLIIAADLARPRGVSPDCMLLYPLLVASPYDFVANI